jgi:hypothetical protein
VIHLLKILWLLTFSSFGYNFEIGTPNSYCKLQNDENTKKKQKKKAAFQLKK